MTGVSRRTHLWALAWAALAAVILVAAVAGIASTVSRLQQPLSVEEATGSWVSESGNARIVLLPDGEAEVHNLGLRHWNPPEGTTVTTVSGSREWWISPPTPQELSLQIGGTTGPLVQVVSTRNIWGELGLATIGNLDTGEDGQRFRREEGRADD